MNFVDGVIWCFFLRDQARLWLTVKHQVNRGERAARGSGMSTINIIRSHHIA